jgi:hypothetical protein
MSLLVQPRLPSLFFHFQALKCIQLFLHRPIRPHVVNQAAVRDFQYRVCSYPSNLPALVGVSNEVKKLRMMRAREKRGPLDRGSADDADVLAAWTFVPFRVEACRTNAVSAWIEAVAQFKSSSRSASCPHLLYHVPAQTLAGYTCHVPSNHLHIVLSWRSAFVLRHVDADSRAAWLVAHEFESSWL